MVSLKLIHSLCSPKKSIRSSLKRKKIGHAVYYPIPLHLQTCFKDLGYQEGDLPEAEKEAKEVISMEKKKGVFDKAHFIEHINYFPIKTVDLLFAKYGFERIPQTIIYPVTTLIDIIKLTSKFIFPESVAAYYFGGFSRMYRYKSKRT